MAAVHPVDLVKPRPGGHIYLTAYDGFYACFFGSLVKLHAAIHNSVVGTSNGGLSTFLDALHQLIDPAGTVQKAVFCMQMQVDELLCCAAHDCPSCSLWRRSSASASSFFMR